MRVQEFVFDWPGEKQHAEATAAVMRPHCETQIISEPRWYFVEQWEECRRRFEGDVLLTVMADVWPPDDFGGMLARAVELLARDDIGIYAPSVAYTGHKLHKHKARELFPNVYDTPVPEMLCWALRRDVLDSIPHVSPDVNKIGWGVDYLAVARSRRTGRRAVTDFNFLARHQKSIGYDPNAATRQYERWRLSLSELDQGGVLQVVEERGRLCVRLMRKIIGGDGTVRGLFYRGLTNEEDHLTLQPRVPKSYEEWLRETEDVQDLFFLDEGFPDDGLRACQANGVDNVFFTVTRNPEEWADAFYGTGWRQLHIDHQSFLQAITPHHWRHPKWAVNMTTMCQTPVAHILPAKMVYR